MRCRRAEKLAPKQTSSSGIITSMWIMLGMRFSSRPNTLDPIADTAMMIVIARQKLMRICRKFSSRTACRNAGSSSASNVSHGKPAFSCRACGKSGRSSPGNRLPVIIACPP